MATTLRPVSPRGPAEPRRAPRRAALAADHLHRRPSSSRFGVCLWQNHAVLDILNRPLAVDDGAQPQRPRRSARAGRATTSRSPEALGAERRRVAARLGGSSARDAARSSAQAHARRGSAAAAARAVPPSGAPAGDAGRRRAVHGDVQGRGLRALLLSLPLLLYQAYAFVLPAFSPARARGRAAADADGAVPVHRRRRVRATTWSLPHGDPVPAELQRRPVRHPHPGAATSTGSRSWSWSRWGCCSSCPSGSSRVTRWGSSRRAAAHNRRYAILVIAIVADAAARAVTRSRCSR